MPDIERNKETFVAFYDLAFNQSRPAEAIARYAADTYIQLKPHVKNGKDGFLPYFEEMYRRYPGKCVTFKRVLTERNFVVLHCLQKWPGDEDSIGIDIFRLDDAGTVVEQWDVLQIASEISANPNGMF